MAPKKVGPKMKAKRQERRQKRKDQLAKLGIDPSRVDPRVFRKRNFNTLKGLLLGQQDANEANIGMQQDLNRFDESNPYGSLSYTKDPVTGRPIKTTTLSSEQQAMLEQQQQNELALGQGAQSQLNQFNQQGQFQFQGLPELNMGWDQRQALEGQLYAHEEKILNERFAQDEDRLKQELINSGNPPGSPLYEKRMEAFITSKNDAFDATRNQIRQFAGQEQQNQYGMNLQGRQQLGQEQLTQFGMPLQFAGTMMGMQKGVQNPNFTPTAMINVPGLDVANAGLGWNTNQTNWNIANLPAKGPGYDVFGLENLKLHNQSQLLQQEHDLKSQWQQPKPNTPNWEDSFTGGFGAGIGEGAGKAAGNYFSK